MSFENLFKILPGTRKSLNLSKKKEIEIQGSKSMIYISGAMNMRRRLINHHFISSWITKDDITTIILNSNIENIPV